MICLAEICSWKISIVIEVSVQNDRLHEGRKGSILIRMVNGHQVVLGHRPSMSEIPLGGIDLRKSRCTSRCTNVSAPIVPRDCRETSEPVSFVRC